MPSSPRAAIDAPVHRLLVLAGLTGFAISQPVLSVLGDEPALVARAGVDGRSVLTFAMAVALLPPLLLWGVAYAVGFISRRAGRAVYLAEIVFLVSMFVVQLIRGIGPERGLVVFGVATLAGCGFMVLYVRVPAAASWAAYTAVLPLLAIGVFAYSSPASALMDVKASPSPRSEGAASDPDLPSVLMLVLDELPTKSLIDAEGQIDEVRYPHLAALARESTWYRHQTTLSPMTPSAVPTLLTGMEPDVLPPTSESYPDNLFTLLAPTHELEVMESATALCPYEDCAPPGADGETSASAAGVGDQLDLVRQVWRERIVPSNAAVAADDFAEEVESTTPTTQLQGAVQSSGIAAFGGARILATPGRVEELMDSFDASQGPALYFLHLMLPHRPWTFYPNGELYSAADPGNERLPAADRHTSWSEWAATTNEQRQILQLSYTDALVGRILDRLKQEGLYDTSAVVVVADHGLSFTPGTHERWIEEDTIDAIAYTPMIVKAPRQQQGAIDDSNIMSIDVLPTIASLLGLDLPWDPDGAAAGSPEVLARGDEKRIHDIRGVSDLEDEGIIRYSDSEWFPQASRRYIAALTDPDDALSAYHVAAGVTELVGRPLAELATESGGAAHIDGLDRLRQRPSDEALFGVVTGRVEDAPEGAVALLAIDGIVISGSHLSTDAEGGAGHVIFLVPQGALDDQNEVQMGLVVAEGVQELRVE